MRPRGARELYGLHGLKGEAVTEEKGLGSYQEVVSFAHHLVEEKGWTAEELLHFLDKPWKWEPEYREWRDQKNNIILDGLSNNRHYNNEHLI